FSQGNLRGVPYFLEFQNSANDGLAMIAHSDYQGFCVRYFGDASVLQRGDDLAVSFPNRSTDANWYALGAAALSSGAFPIGLAPRMIQRNGAEFDYRFVTLPGLNGGPAEIIQLRPSWLPPSKAPNPYTTVVVDGGTMNNEPLELARTELA